MATAAPTAKIRDELTRIANRFQRCLDLGQCGLSRAVLEDITAERAGAGPRWSRSGAAHPARLSAASLSMISLRARDRRHHRSH